MPREREVPSGNDCQRVQVPSVDADEDRRPLEQAGRALEIGLVEGLEQHEGPARVRRVEHGRERGAIEQAQDEQHTARAGDARLEDLQRVDEEVLAQDRQRDGAGDGREVRERAAEARGLGQDRDGGGAGALVAARLPDRAPGIGRARQRTRGGRDELDLGHEVEARRGEPQGRRWRSGARAALELRRTGVERELACSSPARVPHLRQESRARSGRSHRGPPVSDKRARKRLARPSSSAAATARSAARGVASRSRSSSTSAAFRHTASRTGPSSRPSNTARSRAALAPASPPARSAGAQRASPNTSGVSSRSLELPPATSSTRNGPQGVASSKPEPWTTKARCPSSAALRARRCASSGLAAPISWWLGRAGLTSGPSRLKTVRTPSSRRSGARASSEGWKWGANRNTKPSRASRVPASIGSAGAGRPSASIRSALPQREETERLPCFATGIPRLATSSAVAVERLKLCVPSPPVPAVSTQSAPAARGTARARARRPRAKPASSAEVSPLERSAARNAARSESGFVSFISSVKASSA